MICQPWHTSLRPLTVRTSATTRKSCLHSWHLLTWNTSLKDIITIFKRIGMTRIWPITDPWLSVSWLGASSIEVRRVAISVSDGLYSGLGIQPVANESRTDTQFKKIFFIWLSSNCNILSFVNRDPWVPLRSRTHIQIFCRNSWSSSLWARPARRVSRYPVLQYSVLRSACLSVLFFSI